jgi:hypothetical protein
MPSLDYTACQIMPNPPMQSTSCQMFSSHKPILLKVAKQNLNLEHTGVWIKDTTFHGRPRACTVTFSVNQGDQRTQVQNCTATPTRRLLPRRQPVSTSTPIQGHRAVRLHRSSLIQVWLPVKLCAGASCHDTNMSLPTRAILRFSSDELQAVFEFLPSNVELSRCMLTCRQWMVRAVILGWSDG